MPSGSSLASNTNCYRDDRFHSTYFAFLLIFLVSFVFLYSSAFLPLAWLWRYYEHFILFSNLLIGFRLILNLWKILSKKSCRRIRFANAFDTCAFSETSQIEFLQTFGMVVTKSPIGMVSMYDLVGALVVNNWTDVSESFLKTVASGSNSTRSLPDINIEHIESAVDPLWLPFWEKEDSCA